MKTVTILSSAHDGYRRAGLKLKRGRNEVQVDEAQLAALSADPRLAVQEGGDATTGHLAGVVDKEGQVKKLEDLKVDELKDIAKDMEIEGFAELKKADLIAAIKAKQVVIGDGADGAAE